MFCALRNITKNRAVTRKWPLNRGNLSFTYMHYFQPRSNANGTQNPPGITRLKNGPFRARSRRKGYAPDSQVFDSLADATE